MTFQPIEATWPDTELVLIDLLRPLLAARAEPFAQDVYLGNDVPKTRRPRMVIVTRDGGTVRGVFDDARVSVRVFAPTRADAADLTGLVLTLLLAVGGTPEVARVLHTGGPTRLPDDARGFPRLLTFTVRIRGTDTEVAP